MTPIAHSIESVLLNAAPGAHPGDKSWAETMTQLSAGLHERGLHPSRAIVLVPTPS